MKRTLFILISFCLISSIYSQSDYRKGYYITNQNDTIFGWIDYHDDISNAKVCIFKNDSSSTKTTFFPGSIKAYRFLNSKYFVSKTLPKDSANTIVFMEYLINGKVSVYYRRTEDNERYYIEKDGKMAAMNNDESIVEKVSVRSGTESIDKFSKNSNQYKGILKYYFQDAPSISESVDNTTFSKQSIIFISKKYHEKVCNGEQCIVYEKKATKVKFNYGFYVGSGYYSINNKYPFRLVFQANSKPLLSAGVLFQANMPFFNENVYVQLSSGYKSVSLKTQDIEERYKFYETDISGSIDILYKFRYKRIVPFLSFGYIYNIINSSTYSFSYIYYSDPNLIRYNNIASKDKGENSQGILIGGGFEIPIKSHLIYIFSVKYENNFTNIEDIPTCQRKGLMLSTGFLF